MKDANAPDITLQGSKVEFDCKSQVPPGCPKTIEVEISMPQGTTCLTAPSVTIKLDGKPAEGSVKLTVKGRVISTEE